MFGLSVCLNRNRVEGGDELGEGGRRWVEVASEELVVFPRQGAGLEPGELGQPVGQGAAVGEMQVVWTSVRVRGSAVGTWGDAGGVDQGGSEGSEVCLDSRHFLRPS